MDIPFARRLAAQADAELRNGSIDRAEWAVAHIAVLQYQLFELDALARIHAADTALEDALQRPLEGPERMIENMLALTTS
jgi:CRISPR system Cascade subunit CasA